MTSLRATMTSNHYYEGTHNGYRNHKLSSVDGQLNSETSPFPMKEYNGYCLKHLPISARPQPDRKHRGLHSYTVAARVECPQGDMCEILIDVLLRNGAFYVKKAVPETGLCGQVSWKKVGGAHNAWVIAIDKAKTGATSPWVLQSGFAKWWTSLIWAN